MIVENTDAKPVRGLQSMLRNISYYVDDVLRVVPDGNFTEDTKNSVISFQKTYGLNPTGEVDNATWDKIRDVNNELNRIYVNPKLFAVFGKRIIINKDDEIPELFVVQSMLYNVFLDFPNAPEVDITGVHDEKSVEAVVFVHNITGLEPTGVIDTLTYNNIADLYASNVARRV